MATLKLQGYVDTHAPAYKVGDGATAIHYSDTEAGTVITVSASGKRLTWQRDKVTRLTKPRFISGGFAGHCVNNQDIKYSYERSATGYTVDYSLRTYYRNKFAVIIKALYCADNPNHSMHTVWVRIGDPLKNGQTLRAGRAEYYDYNF